MRASGRAFEPRNRPIVLLAPALALLAGSTKARAQVHWDAGIQAGVTDRLTSRDGSATPALPGPSGELHAHVAVVPMLRVGPYAAFDWSRPQGQDARDSQVYAAGLRAKLTPPVLPAPWHAWAFLGLGFADAVTPRHVTMTGASVESLSRGMFEVPLGLGAAHKLHGPWELYAELVARIVAIERTIGAAPSGQAASITAPLGDDLLAVSLSVGVSLAR